MATYKGIQGRSVQSLSSDPSSIEDSRGQIWYNSTTGTFKLATENDLSTGAWASAPSINTARYYFHGAGSPTAGLVAAGSPGGRHTETYDGSTWTAVNTLNAIKSYPGVGGTSTAALCAGSQPPGNDANTEIWDGTCWAETSNLNTSRGNAGPVKGPTTAAIVMGGAGGDIPGDSGATETFDGTSWTETGHNMNSPAVQGKAGLGIQTASMSVGGEPTATVSETYNGTTWTEGSDINTGRGNFSGSGTVTAGIIFGGYPYAEGQKSETYDGTSWSAAPTISQSHGSGCAGGDVGSSISGSFIAGGYAPGMVSNVDHWTYTQFAAKTVTVT